MLSPRPGQIRTRIRLTVRKNLYFIARKKYDKKSVFHQIIFSIISYFVKNSNILSWKADKKAEKIPIFYD